MKNLATFLFAIFFTFSQVAFIPQEANAGRIGSAFKAYKSFSMPKARVSVPRTTYRAPARAWKPTRTTVSYKPSRIAAKPAMPKATIKLGNKTVSGKQAVTIKSNQARAKKYASLYNKPAKNVKFPANTKNLKIDKKAAAKLNKDVKKTAKLIKKADKKFGEKKSNGRTGKQAKLREIANDPKASSADRGWIKQEMNSIKRGQRKTIRNPRGKDLAHDRGREAAKGYGYEHSKLKDRDLHRLQHKYDNFGLKNKQLPL